MFNIVPFRDSVHFDINYKRLFDQGYWIFAYDCIYTVYISVMVKNIIYLVFKCLFILFGKTKTFLKKSSIWYHSIQNSKNGLDKMIGTLNLIFGSTPFGKNNWDQLLPVTINGFLTPLDWNVGPLFFCQLLQASQIWRVPSPNCCFEISPQVFYGI